MAEDTLHGPSQESLEAGYDTSGVSIRGVLWFAVILIITAIVLHVAIFVLLRGYWYVDSKHDRLQSALQVIEQPAPPPPRIQPNPFDSPDGRRPSNLPPEDLKAMYDNEDEAFKQMGWQVETGSHHLAIPDRYIEQVVREAGQRQQESSARQGSENTQGGQQAAGQGSEQAGQAR